MRIPIGRTPCLSLGLVALTYAAGCLLPGEPAAGERIEFRFDFPPPYRVPLAGSGEPPITIVADGRILQNPRYRLESLDTALVRVDASGRRVEGVARGPAAVRVTYQTAMGTPDTVLPIQVVVAQVRVSRPSLALPHLGASSRLNATAWDANNVLVLNVPFAWSTADSTVAVVNDTGLVTAVDEGTTIIVAAADGVADSSSIVVTQAVAAVRIVPELDTVRTVGRSVQFIALAIDSNGTIMPNAKPRWTTSDSTVARIDSIGRATAKGAGVTRIIARVGAAADTAMLVVKQVVRFVTVTPSLDTLTAIAEAARVVASASDSLDFPILAATVSWTTSDSTIARVDTTGLVTAAANGVVLITAASGNHSAFATVVVQQQIAGTRVSPDGVSLTGAGDTVRLSAAAFDRNGFALSGAAFTWRSTDGFVATVDSTGLVTARVDGLAKIVVTADLGGQSDTATVSVTGAPPPPGVLLIRTTTTGVSPDSDGYTVEVDGGIPISVGTNDSIAVAKVAGSHVVALTGIAINCTVAGGNFRTVSLSWGDTTRVDFAVTCAAPGTLRITTTTTGLNPDADGYLVVVDEYCEYYYGCYNSWTAPVGVNDSVAWTPAVPGTHTVGLSGLTGNCTVTGQNPVTVTISSGVTTQVTFNVTCVQAGSVRVTTTTTGADLDPDGYGVGVSGSLGGQYSPIGVNASYTFDHLLPGDYSVELGAVAANCTIGGPASQAVTVVGGATADVAFAVTCEPLAAIRVAVTTTGTDPDQDGYVLHVEGPGTFSYLPAPGNGTVLVPRVLGGTYTLRLDGLAINCSLGGQGQDTVTVAAGDTADVAFDVGCTAAELLAVAMNVNNNTDVYLVKSNGTGLVRLTTDAAADYAPAWSASSGKIAFVSERDGNSEIYVMNADGSGQLRLTTNAGTDRDPAWSPDDLKLAFWSTRDGNQEIYVMNADGSNLVRVTNDAFQDTDPAWSPDGLRIAFASNRDGIFNIYRMNADGSGVSQLTFTGFGESHQPDWSPSGSKLAYVRRHCPYYCESNLVVMNADGSGAVVLPSGDAADPVWSPDGQWIAFSQVYCDYYQCYVGGGVGAISTSGTRWVSVMAGAFQPAWRR